MCYLMIDSKGTFFTTGYCAGSKTEAIPFKSYHDQRESDLENGFEPKRRIWATALEGTVGDEVL